ncbi:MAG: extracellular solute-binding protein [Oscillospiraceae bacterium]|nr:extracellular solute-binding protein [Oscillospiraceae bacterium]
MKRILATLLVLVMVCSLAACGEKEGEKSAEGKKVIKLWSITVDTDSNRQAYIDSIAEVNKLYPDYEIQMEATENEAYKEKIKNAMAANSVEADIFFTWSGGFLNEFVKQDRVYELDDAFKDVKGKDIEDKMFANVTFNGHIYAVPTTMNIVAMFANMDMLKSVGYNDVPKTYDELIDCCDKLVAAGKIPFGCAGGETWCVTEYLEPLAEKTIGSDALSKMFAGEGSYNDAGLAKAVDYLQEWIKKGYFDPAGATTGNEQIKTNFIEGKYAFYQNGSWNCGDITAKAKFEVKVAEFPVIDSSKSAIGELIGGPSDVLAVYKGSKNAETAAKMVVKLGQLICEKAYANGNGLPAWKVSVDESKIDPLLSAVAGIVGNSKSLTLFGDTKMSGTDKDVYLSYVDKVYSSQIDGAGFIAGLAKDLR